MAFVFRRMLLNIALILGSVLLTYLLIELVVFRPALQALPRPMFQHMIREMRVLGQHSKAALTPAPGYIAIAGDSYAQGKGDWFIDQGYDRNKAYQATHILHKILQRDVVTFGRSGAGSVDGALIEPLQTIRFARELGLDFTDPEVMFIYFYEGNDIQNNLGFLRRRLNNALPDTPAFQSFLDKLTQEYASGSVRQTKDAPLFGNFVLRLLRNTIRNTFTRKYIDIEEIETPGKVNRILLNGKETPIPDHVQAPPLELNAADIEKGLFIFDQTLAYAKKIFPKTRLLVAYIPAPLSCYKIESKKVSVFYDSDSLYPAADVARQNNALAERVKQIAVKQDLEFIDTGIALREIGRTHLQHGPRDWDHFNKKGYETFTKALAAPLEIPPDPTN